MKSFKTIAVLLSAGLFGALGTLASDDPGQDPNQAPVYKSFRQPWTKPAAPHLSRVESCDNPVPLDRAALDDFVAPATGDVVALRWWGALFDADQVGKPYYVAIYADNDCEPGDLLYETCVVPTGKCIAFDCLDHKIALFRSPVPAFAVAAGQHYWLQISEDDANGANVGFDDWAWSGRQPRRLCPAIQIGANGQVQRPLIDACNGQVDDLSFEVIIRLPKQ